MRSSSHQLFHPFGNWTFRGCIFHPVCCDNIQVVRQSVTQSVGHFPLSFGQKQIKFKRPRPPQRQHYQQRCAWREHQARTRSNFMQIGLRRWLGCVFDGGRPWTSQPPAFASKLKSLFSKDYYSRLQYRI